jgi:hypothetical protein
MQNHPFELLRNLTFRNKDHPTSKKSMTWLQFHAMIKRKLICQMLIYISCSKIAFKINHPKFNAPNSQFAS